MVHKIDIDQFITLVGAHPLFDVRSPGEYGHAHIPGAHSLPLFSDEERKIVGTAYKQQSRETAIKIGLDYYGVKMRSMVEEVERIVATEGNGSKTILVHCWRGGMRSGAVAWLLDLYGFKVYTLAEGYKAFRTWVLAQFSRPYQLNILGGYTGAGKTEVLHELKKKGEKVVDLEDLAGHKGSAFGGIGLQQPMPEMFENKLALALHALTIQGEDPIWVENESQRIGNINLPKPFFDTMLASPVYFLDIPFEVRLDYLVREYGKLKKEELVNAVIRIQKRLGGLNTKNAVNALIENDHHTAFGILLRYYDKFYEQGLADRRERKIPIHSFAADAIDARVNAGQLLSVKI
jgi:tRNA 2-selenouridine synthase